jgi:hypothetical protein
VDDRQQGVLSARVRAILSVAFAAVGVPTVLECNHAFVAIPLYRAHSCAQATPSDIAGIQPAYVGVLKRAFRIQ